MLCVLFYLHLVLVVSIILDWCYFKEFTLLVSHHLLDLQWSILGLSDLCSFFLSIITLLWVSQELGSIYGCYSVVYPFWLSNPRHSDTQVVIS